MAQYVYVKSIIWLVSLGGIGYGLMQLTAPSAEKIERIKATTSRAQLTEGEQNKVQFLKKLQEAAGERPIYAPPTAKSTKAD